MFEEQVMQSLTFTDATTDEGFPAQVHHQLADGRMVPVTMGGLVEMALFELGGKLVDAVEQDRPGRTPGLN